MKGWHFIAADLPALFEENPADDGAPSRWLDPFCAIAWPWFELWKETEGDQLLLADRD